MAHMIANINGMDSFARAAGTEKAWHGLGQIVPANGTIEEWAHAAGLAYRVKRARVRYYDAPEGYAGPNGDRTLRDVDGRVVQFRSDTGAELGIVSDGFQTVQPIEVLELFREWADRGGVTIETAGALFGGRVYFALAKIGDAVSIDRAETDKLVPYIYASTACDGSRKTTTMPTSIRVVCKNTDALAQYMNRDARRAFDAQSHRSEFNASQARATIESSLEQFGAFVAMARKLANIGLASEKAAEFTRELVGNALSEKGRENAAFARIMANFTGAGMGATLDTSHGTAWGFHNAVTQYVDHEKRATCADNRFDSAQNGPGAALKARALELVAAL